MRGRTISTSRRLSSRNSFFADGSPVVLSDRGCRRPWYTAEHRCIVFHTRDVPHFVPDILQACNMFCRYTLLARVQLLVRRTSLSRNTGVARWLAHDQRSKEQSCCCKAMTRPAKLSIWQNLSSYRLYIELIANQHHITGDGKASTNIRRVDTAVSATFHIARIVAHAVISWASAEHSSTLLNGWALLCTWYTPRVTCSMHGMISNKPACRSRLRQCSIQIPAALQHSCPR